MIVFTLNGHKVVCNDIAVIDMKKANTLTLLAKDMEAEIENSECYIDFVFNCMVIRNKKDKNEEIRIGFDDAGEKVEYDSYIRTCLRFIQRYHEAFNSKKGGE